MDSNTAVEDTVDVLTDADLAPVIELIIILHFRTESSDSVKTMTVTESTLTSPEKVTISESESLVEICKS